ncbi:hypothetical protein PHET_04118 [Paragonimus heterotremus]|uniref:Cytochrome b561 domain-containing protein n=1 Tax=Paragonimus heterotremus TaxID=100268 RepID=A0A8J4T006_9TREM|nr:hypothetical protein PHET_04118 [Paragonimus heterotremus]
MIPDLIKVHGCLMLFGWNFFLNNGIILSRHYKQMWQQHNLGGLALWFVFHQLFNSMAVVCTVLAVFIVVYHSRGYSELDLMPFAAHPPCGFISGALILLNPLVTLFRCEPTHKMRPAFNWVHFIFGTVAQTLSVPTIAIGLIMQRQASDSDQSGQLNLYLASVVFHCIVELFLELFGYEEIMRYRAIFQTVSDRVNVEDLDSKRARFKKLTYYLYFAVSLAFTVALVVMLATA